MNTQRLLLIFCILVLIGLTGKVSLDSTRFDCGGCAVNLYNYGPNGDKLGSYENISVQKLFNGMEDGMCLFIFDKNSGYINNGYR